MRVFRPDELRMETGETANERIRVDKSRMHDKDYMEGLQSQFASTQFESLMPL